MLRLVSLTVAFGAKPTFRGFRPPSAFNEFAAREATFEPNLFSTWTVRRLFGSAGSPAAIGEASGLLGFPARRWHIGVSIPRG